MIKQLTQLALQSSFDGKRAVIWGIAACFPMLLTGVLAFYIAFDQGSEQNELKVLAVLLSGVLLQAVIVRLAFQWVRSNWNRIAQEMQHLQKQMDGQLSSLREGFLLQLVQGYFKSLPETDLRERMEHYGLNVKDRQFVAMMVQVGGFVSQEGKFSAGNEQLAIVSVWKTIRELTEKRFAQADLIPDHDLSIGVLLAVPAEYRKDEVKTEVTLWCEEFAESVHSQSNLEITISFSSSAARVEQIPELFAKARAALKYRDLQIQNQIIDTELLDSSDHYQAYNYPFALEKEIIHSIRLGLTENTESRLELFLQELTADSANQLVVQQGMVLLLCSIHHTLLDIGLNPNQVFDSFNLFEPFSQLREPEEMLYWFKNKVIRPLVSEMEKGKDQKLQQMVEKVVIHLQEQYMTDISLDLCADQLGISPYTLSKVFKQITGLNFIDYLTDIRIGKAKELLRGTEIKINDVAEQIGYQPSYFARIFKRHEGVTPSKYRDMSRSKIPQRNY